LLRIIVGYGGSSPAGRALDAAVRLLQGRAGCIDVVCVAHLSPGQLRGRGADWQLERRQGGARRMPLTAWSVRSPSAWPAMHQFPS